MRAVGCIRVPLPTTEGFAWHRLVLILIKGSTCQPIYVLHELQSPVNTTIRGGKTGHRRLRVKPSWTVQKQLSWPSSVCQWKNGYDSKQIMNSGSGCVMSLRSDRLLMATCAVTSCKCRPTGVPLYDYHVRIYSFVTVSTKSHPNHTCRDEEWAFLWSRRPLFSWAKILFVIVRRYSCMMTWAY